RFDVVNHRPIAPNERRQPITNDEGRNDADQSNAPGRTTTPITCFKAVVANRQVHLAGHKHKQSDGGNKPDNNVVHPDNGRRQTSYVQVVNEAKDVVPNPKGQQRLGVGGQETSNFYWLTFLVDFFS